MKTPGIGQRKKKFKQLLGWGKQKTTENPKKKFKQLIGWGKTRNAGKSNKRKITRDSKIPRNIRHRRAKRNKRV